MALRSRCCFECSPTVNCLWAKWKKADAPKTFSYVYAMDPSSLDYSVTSKLNLWRYSKRCWWSFGLENDKYGNLIPSLAEDWSVSKDGLTYTYKLRKGVKWYTSDGEEYAEVSQRLTLLGLTCCWRKIRWSFFDSGFYQRFGRVC